MNNLKLILVSVLLISCATTISPPKEGDRVLFYPKKFSPGEEITFSFVSKLDSQKLSSKYGDGKNVKYLDSDNVKILKKQEVEMLIYNVFSVAERFVEYANLTPVFYFKKYECENVSPENEYEKLYVNFVCIHGKEYAKNCSGSSQRYCSVGKDRDDLSDFLSFVEKTGFEKYLANNYVEKINYQSTNPNELILESDLFTSEGQINSGSIDGSEYSLVENEFKVDQHNFASTVSKKPIYLNFNLSRFFAEMNPVITKKQCKSMVSNLAEKSKEYMIQNLISQNSGSLKTMALDREGNSNYIDYCVNSKISDALNFQKDLWELVFLHYTELELSKNGDVIKVNAKINLPKMMKEIKILKREDLAKMSQKEFETLVPKDVEEVSKEGDSDETQEN